ncbi:predicted protein [Nematostella vectensis]|uniref:Uncharacterized protein n=1 Tax=Nematostella vectensis TaxID=45351 RepID=A7S5U2_NEMVE|nr:predicted protein [Nematostella vectensis]|eukprot:XP_001633028.1 predicted protein [Nematostella vectensis]
MADKLKTNVTLSHESMKSARPLPHPQICITDYSQEINKSVLNETSRQTLQKVEKETQASMPAQVGSAEDVRDVIYEEIKSAQQQLPQMEDKSVFEETHAGKEISAVTVKNQTFHINNAKPKTQAPKEKGLKLFSKKFFSRSNKGSRMKASKSVELLSLPSNQMINEDVQNLQVHAFKTIEVRSDSTGKEVDNLLLKEENRRLVDEVCRMEEELRILRDRGAARQPKTVLESFENGENFKVIENFSDVTMHWDDSFDVEHVKTLQNTPTPEHTEDGNTEQEIQMLEQKADDLVSDSNSMRKKLVDVFKENEVFEDKVAALRTRHETEVQRLKDENFSLKSRVDNLMTAKTLSERSHQKLKLVNKWQKAIEDDVILRCSQLVYELNKELNIERESNDSSFSKGEEAVKQTPDEMSESILECFEYIPEKNTEFMTTVKMARSESKLSIVSQRSGSTYSSCDDLLAISRRGSGRSSFTSDASNALSLSTSALDSDGDLLRVGEGRVSRFPPPSSPVQSREKRREKGKPKNALQVDNQDEGRMKQLNEILSMLESKCKLMVRKYKEKRFHCGQVDEKVRSLQKERDQIFSELEGLKKAKEQQDVMLICLRNLQKENDSMKLDNFELRNSLNRASKCDGPFLLFKPLKGREVGVDMREQESLERAPNLSVLEEGLNYPTVNSFSPHDLSKRSLSYEETPRYPALKNAVQYDPTNILPKCTKGCRPNVREAGRGELFNNRERIIKNTATNEPSESLVPSNNFFTTDKDNTRGFGRENVVINREGLAKSPQLDIPKKRNDRPQIANRMLNQHSKVAANKVMSYPDIKKVEIDRTDRYRADHVINHREFWFEEEFFAEQEPSPEPPQRERCGRELERIDEISVDGVEIELDDIDIPYPSMRMDGVDADHTKALANSERVTAEQLTRDIGLTDPDSDINSQKRGFTYGIAVKVEQLQLNDGHEKAKMVPLRNKAYSQYDSPFQATHERPVYSDKRFRSKSVKTRKENKTNKPQNDPNHVGGNHHEHCSSILALLTHPKNSFKHIEKKTKAPTKEGGVRKTVSLCRSRDRLYRVHYV